jgi:2-(1,2-epoxy-1,2-dihydrophenyl)acetyl-CoA isomerase
LTDRLVNSNSSADFRFSNRGRQRPQREVDVEKVLVLTDVRDGYRVLTLNRPDRLNAFTADMHGALFAALSEAEYDKTCRALILTGAGRGFCAGQDLSDFVFAPGEPPDLSVPLAKYYNPLVRKLRHMPIPIICAVNGVAAGAGANVAFACDIVIAARSAKFSQAFAKLGLVPDSGGTWFLPRLVGGARARALALLAETIPAEKAEAWGMIWKMVDDGELMAEAHRLGAYFASQPTDGLALIKQAFIASETNSLDQQLDLERDLQGQAGRSADCAEGFSAFLEKRSPNFAGRR